MPLIGTPGGPTSMWEMDSNVLLAFLESLLRESEDGTEQIDKLYDGPPSEDAREREIHAFLNMVS